MSDDQSHTGKFPEGAGALPRAGGSAECPLAIGTQLGRYRVLRPLGAGGMGEVYVADDARLGRQVAVKVIRGSTPLTPVARARFEQEARAASALTHPNIITIYDIGDAGDQPFIVMELLDGQSLRDLLQTPLAPADVIRLGAQIADALAASHERGIVHRDLKPENVFVTAEGNAKILDFGVARIRGAVTDDGITVEQLTIKGSAIGTIGYMAPEVVAGQPADFRADIFSLGCVLYEMAAGRRAFTGRSLTEVLAASLREEPPALSAIRSDLPPAFSAIVETSLRKDPAQRYSATGALRDELAALASAVKSGAGLSQRTRSLPRFDFPLLGREGELAAIRSMIVDEKARLVTLTGPGGSGKTRLVLSAAEQLFDWFAGRVFFVPLASVTDPDLVGAAIAQALGAGDPSRPPVPAVIASLRATESRSLLVVDNFEQVIDAASLLAELIAECASVTILVTSREILHLYSERNLPVPPLPVPEPVEWWSSEDVMKNPAVTLFVQRARAVNPALELDPPSIAAVAEICRRLDGLPLAIELAAARTRLMTPRAMLGRIGERLKLLTGGARDLPGRQQTLRRTLDWSYELLTPGEQALIRRLSVFAGSFTLEGAEAVADPFGRLELDVVDVVGSLVDKSLLVGKGEQDGEPRFAMLGMVRDYAAEQLAASGEEEETRKAHAAYYLVVAEEGAQAQRAGENAVWMARLAREHDNIRAALEWTTASGRTEWGLRMAVGMFPFWERSEHLSEGRKRLDALLAHPQDPGDDLLRARALFSTAVLACTQKDYEPAIAQANAGLALHRRLNDRHGIAVSCNSLGVMYTELRRLDEAAPHLEESLSLWKAIGDEASYARSLTNLAVVRRLQGDRAAAQQMYIETEALFRRINDPTSAAWALNHQGDVARELEQFQEASHDYASALRAFRELGDSWGIATSLLDIGNLARRTGRLEDAAPAYRESLEHFGRLGHSRGIARVLEAMALLAGARDRFEQALTLAGAAARVRDLIGAPLPEQEQAEFDRELERALGALGGEGRRNPYQCGRCMGMTEAIAYALAAAR
ncbi:MAG TPA: protein kinase [Thermoanaerobaculia bacterium]|nr:protein kinase [Thermoanaerobaculia bacterium]